MSSNSSKWLIGCSIGCSILILLIVIVGISGYFFIKDKVEVFKNMETTMESLEDKYGKIRDFCPDPDGAITPERIEAFLAVRDSMIFIRRHIEQTLDTISTEIRIRGEVKQPTDTLYESKSEKKSSWQVLKIIRKGIGAMPKLAEFYMIRNRALLDAEMGLGEYYYIYVLAYYSWLGKSPSDGPAFQLMGENKYYKYDWHKRDEIENKDNWDDEHIREERRYRIIKRINRMFLPMLRCQLEELTKRSSSEYQKSWKKALEFEITALESDRDRLPWQDGLPKVLTASLNPFRERLEASYSEMLNPVEINPN